MTTTTGAEEPMTTTPLACWMEAFPPSSKTNNDLTCDICTVIFQGLDDYLLNNEEQVQRAGISQLIWCLTDHPCSGEPV